jgi:hypothetical protein
VCIFFVAPLVLFGYFEVHTRTIHHHHAEEHDVKVRDHFSKDILAQLTDELEEEEENAVNTTDINSAGNTNTSSVVVKATTSSTLKTSKAKDTMEDDTADADNADETNSDEDSKGQKDNRVGTKEKADTQKGEKRVLRQRLIPSLKH